MTPLEKIMALDGVESVTLSVSAVRALAEENKRLREHFSNIKKGAKTYAITVDEEKYVLVTNDEAIIAINSAAKEDYNKLKDELLIERNQTIEEANKVIQDFNLQAANLNGMTIERNEAVSENLVLHEEIAKNEETINKAIAAFAVMPLLEAFKLRATLRAGIVSNNLRMFVKYTIGVN